jgi:riboflavin-specific deaminase-like protein
MNPQPASHEPPTDPLPFVFLNAALSADGKLAPATRRYIPFGSKHDEALLYDLRAQADAVMCGARTIDLQPVTLGNGGDTYRRRRLRRGLAPYPLRVIVSGSGSVNPEAEIFRHRFSPILVITTRRAAGQKTDRLRQVADQVEAHGGQELDLRSALRWLASHWQVKRLLCEGGGQLNAALFREGLVNEVHLTVCPFIFGGRDAPTLADGLGALRLTEAVRLERVSGRQIGNEMFLRYRVLRSLRVPL